MMKSLLRLRGLYFNGNPFWRKTDLMIRLAIGCAIRLRIAVENRFAKNSPREMLPEIKTVLLLAFYGIGDSLMLTPAIRALKQAKKGIKITVVTKHEFKEIFTANPYIDEVVAIDKKDFLQTAKKLSQFKYDLFLMFIATFEYYIFSVLLKPRYRLGYLSSYHAVEAVGMRVKSNKNIFINAVKRNLRIVEVLIGKSLTDKKDNLQLDYFSPGDKMDSGVLAEIGEMKKTGITIISINPNKTASWGGAGMWPIENYAAVINHLLQNYKDIRICLLGANSELHNVNNLAALIASDNKDRIINLAGKTSLAELAFVLRASNLLITNDSGVMHLGLAVKVPVISIFGFSDPESFNSSPYNIVLFKNIECSPCIKNGFNPVTNYPRYCPDPSRCMKQIKPEEVLEKAQIVLK
jgi:ADP-heptose:LPS heptosyltransferase